MPEEIPFSDVAAVVLRADAEGGALLIWGELPVDGEVARYMRRSSVGGWYAKESGVKQESEEEG